MPGARAEPRVTHIWHMHPQGFYEFVRHVRAKGRAPGEQGWGCLWVGELALLLQGPCSS